ncbi:protein unc-13 homolog 4B-like [Drosophila novamexicana]|nr:protein unc-13 homolog 4B-like [Drosophila novamexicana]
MISCFKIGEAKTSDVKILSEIENRYRNQKEQSTAHFGQLTITGQFTDSGLLLKILNARSLVSVDKTGLCDSFVKVYMMPTGRFNGFAPVKTAVHNKNCFPLYDEQFNFNLNSDQRLMEDSLILFSVKDKDLFGMTSQYIAECYITFADLIASKGEQIIMSLSRPEYTDSMALRALEHRQGDKQAKDFLKKLKSKSNY